MQQHVALSRIHHSWLNVRERQTLTWIAARLPTWLTSDHLTLLGIAGAAICGISYAACLVWPGMLWVACFGLVLNWCGDSLDGSLARYRGIERPRYGFFVDHSADVLSQLFIFFGLGMSPFMRFDMALLALMSYWLAAFYTFIRAIATQVFQISYFGIGPTEIRLGLIAYSLVLLVAPPFKIATPVGRASLLDAAVLVSFCVVLITFTLAAYTESRRLAVLEPMPRRTTPQERAR
jgi:phosphatidylglycerophosphate synthase